MKKQLLLTLSLIAVFLLSSLHIRANTNEDTYEFLFLLGYGMGGNITLVEDAVVSLDYEVNTAGDYVFSGVEAGTYKYIIKAEGQPTISGFVNVPNDFLDPTMASMMATLFGINWNGSMFQPMLIGYPGGASATYPVTFNIKDSFGAAIDDATVTIDGVSYAADDVELEAGIYDYTVSKDGYISTTGKMIVVDNTEVVNVLLDQPADFTFIPGYMGVDWSSGSPQMTGVYVGDATISLDYQVNAASDYTFTSVMPGEHKYIIKKEGKPNVSGRVNVPSALLSSENGDIQYMLMLYGITVSGMVYGVDMTSHSYSDVVSDIYPVTFNITDKEGNAIDGATVTIDGVSYAADNVKLEAGIYDYTVSKDGYISTTGKMIVVDNTEVVDVVMNESYDIYFLLGYFDIANMAIVKVDDATVSMDYTVNAANDCAFYNVASGTYKYVVKKEGEPTVSGKVRVPEDLFDSATAAMLLAMYGVSDWSGYVYQPMLLGYPGGTSTTYPVTFNIIDKEGNAIDGATVTIDGTDYPADNVVLEGGIYEYTVSKAGHVSVTGKMIVVDDTEVVDVVMEESYDIYFLLGYLDMQAMAIVKVDDATVSMDYTVNAANDCAFYNVASGTYKYVVKKEGEPTISGKVRVPEDLFDSATAAMLLAMYGVSDWNGYVYQPILLGYPGGTSTTYPVTFNITDKEGNAIDDATVTIDGTDYPADNVVIEAGIYNYSVYKAGYPNTTGKMIVVDDTEVVDVVLGESDGPLTYNFTVATVYLDPETFEPVTIADAIVSLNDKVNEANDYFFKNMAEGDYKYIIRKEGYPTASGRMNVPNSLEIAEDPLPEWFGLEGLIFAPDMDTMIAMGKEGPSAEYAVTFNITDTEGNAIDGATVTINEVAYPSGSVVIEAGFYDYTVSMAGYISASGSMIIVDNQEVIEVVLEKSPTYDFTVLVAYLDPATFSPVTITDATVSLNGLVNEKNDYVFEDMAEGDYKFIIKKEGYPTASGWMNIPNNLEIAEDPLPEWFGVEGLIFLPDATMMIAMGKEGPSAKYLVTFNITDQDGNAVEGMAVTIDGVDYTPGNVEIEAGIYTYTVSKDRYKTITGSMIIVDGQEVIDVVTEYYGEIDDQYEYDFVVLDDIGDIAIMVVSENGKYVGGTYYGSNFIHNTNTKETQVFSRNKQADNIAGITNDGTCYGTMGDVDTAHPGYRPWGGEWTELPGIGEDLNCALTAVSVDGKLLGGWSYEGDDYVLWKPCLWKQNEAGNYVKEFLPFPVTDFTGREAQGSRVVQFSTDNSVIRGAYVPYYGPGEGHTIIWRQAGNSYEYEMVGEEIIYDAQTGQRNDMYYLSPYYANMSANGKYLVSVVQYYKIEGASYSVRQNAIFFNIETPGSATYQIIEDPNYGDYAAYTGVYGATVLNDGYIFASTPFQSGQYPSTGLAYTGEDGYIDYAEWLKINTGVDIFENSKVLLSGFPVISTQENLFAGSYSLGPNVNENVTSYYVKKRLKTNIPQDEFTFLMGYKDSYGDAVRFDNAVISLDYTVNEKNDYKFTNVEEGDYKYIIKKDNYPTLSGTLNVPNDLDDDVVLADLFGIEGYFYQPDFTNYTSGVASPLFDVDFTLVYESEASISEIEGSVLINGVEYDLGYDISTGKSETIQLEAGIYDYSIADAKFYPDTNDGVYFYSGQGKIIVVASETFSLNLIHTGTLDIDQVGASQFSLYPNPFTDKIMIGNPGEVKSVGIYNVSGQCVLATGLEGANSISTAHLPKGTYVVTIEDRSGNKSSYKMIK